MEKKIKGLVLASVLFAGTASAEFNYTYAEGGLGMLNLENQSLIGFDLRGSYLINENIFAFGGFRMLSDDIDYTNWNIGAGYRHALDAKTDVWGGGGLDYQESEFETTVCSGGFFSQPTCTSATSSFDSTAPFIRGGVRHQLNQEIELGASARLVTGDFDYLGLNGQARYRMQDNLSLTGEIDLQDGDFGLFAGATYFF